MPLGARALAAIAVVATLVIAIDVNLLASRRSARWDFTSGEHYTLSDPTLQTLRGLEAPVSVYVLLGANEPLTASLRLLLEAYKAESQLLALEFVDPDQHPAEFLALQERYRVVAGRSETGDVVTDRAVIVAQGERAWFIERDDLVRFDEESGRQDSRLEQALTEALRRVGDETRTELCLTAGHGERSAADHSPDGLSELTDRLKRNNYEVKVLDLADARPGSLSGCELVLVAGPRRAYPERVSEELQRHVEAGGAAFLLLDPRVTREDRALPQGLEPLLGLAQTSLGQDLVLERDPKLALPHGVGERFFVEPERHAITERLFRRSGTPLRLLVTTAQDLKLTDTGKAVALGRSSAESFALHDLAALHQAEPPTPSPKSRRGPLVLALAAEIEVKPSTATPSGAQSARLVVAGTSSLVMNRNWQDPALYANRLFAESAVAWLLQKPDLVSVPEKPEQTIGLNLSEETLSEVWRYVLLYMPGTAILIASLVLYRRFRGPSSAELGDGAGRKEAS